MKEKKRFEVILWDGCSIWWGMQYKTKKEAVDFFNFCMELFNVFVPVIGKIYDNKSKSFFVMSDHR